MHGHFCRGGGHSRDLTQNKDQFLASEKTKEHAMICLHMLDQSTLTLITLHLIINCHSF